jgi:hypothetical protein
VGFGEGSESGYQEALGHFDQITAVASPGAVKNWGETQP